MLTQNGVLYITVRLRFNLSHSPTLTASDCQTASGQITLDESEQGTDGYEGKDFEKKKSFKTTIDKNA